MPTTVPGVTAGDVITEAWGDAVSAAVTELQTAPPAHGSTHQPGAGDAIPTATAGASGIGDSAATGTSTSLSRADHRHSREAFETPVTVGTANAAGSATTVARSDHVHKGHTRHARGSVASLGAGSGGEVALTWDVPFPNTSYTIAATAGYSDGTSRNPPNHGIRVETKSTTGVTIRVLNNAAVSETVYVEAIAIPD